MTLIFVALATSGWAQGEARPRPLGRELPDVVQNWADRLRSADALLQAGEWKKAKKTVDFLLEEMQTRVAGGEDAGRFLGMACLYRAIAESGLGNEREALWDFGMAQALHPELAKADFGPYGASGAALEVGRRGPGWKPAPDSGQESPKTRSGKESSESRKIPGVRAPEKLRAPAIFYPYAKSQACDTESLVVLMIIRKDGLTSVPVVLTKSDPVLSFAAMDTLRSWKFRPAELAGEPVTAFYNVTVNYKQLYCPNSLALATKNRDKP